MWKEAKVAICSPRRSAGLDGRVHQAHGASRVRARSCVTMYVLACPQRECGVVHWDDVAMLGHAEQLNWFKGAIERRFESKYRRRLGPAEDDEKEMRI